MIIFRRETQELFDLHSHIIPYVDDGAEDLEEAKSLIREEYSQGVRFIVMTVHLRSGMFETSVQKVKRHFSELKEWLPETDMSDLEVCFSREYYCDERFEALLDAYIQGKDFVEFDGKRYSSKEEIIPFGNKKCILLEFSSGRNQKDEYGKFIKKVMMAGLTPIIAHAERYPAVQANPELIYELRKAGAYIQVNCDSILENGSKRVCETADILLKNDCVDIVCSDVHDMCGRVINMKKCFNYVKKKYGIETAKLLFHDNAEYLIKNYEYLASAF
ncbi:tyrosine-protein phosphatase [Butyrivibrio sp. MB2005]|uniref:tyrosine-protein phosphatase n=1 Tax=Butyrivibrio sp. MB2005 TaxID=1280678 RepID=UPI000416DFFB|nr:CpsB/CapC family capsule biosynthesis tyrosine phosphatase [Butyrivibrio sp. MB2005]